MQANCNVNPTVESGTIHGIIGENGAGKFTLMSILYGFYQADAGEIRVQSKPLKIHSAHDAIESGIGMVHQHFMLVDTFTVLENVVLGVESGFQLDRSLEEARQAYRLEVDADALIQNLPVACSSVWKSFRRSTGAWTSSTNPTGVLTPQAADDLLRILSELCEQGKTVILITHKFREIMAITDHVSVMRQGKMVAHRTQI